MNTAKLFRYGDINYWTANYAEGGADLIKAAVQEHEAQDKPTYHIRPASLTAERRAEVDRILEGYVRLNNKYGYKSGEQAYSGDKPIVVKEYRRPRRTLLQRVRDFFVEEIEE